jgi:hypothetical protein
VDQEIGADTKVDKIRTLREQRCRQVVETYYEIEDMLTAEGRKVPSETIGSLCSPALRLILVRP